MTDDPYTQVDRERALRWARRDRSMFPLTDIERAERRHHTIVDQWMLFYVAPPLLIAVLPMFAMRSGAALIVTGALMLAATFLYVVFHLVTSSFIYALCRFGARALIGAALCTTIAAIALLMLAPQYAPAVIFSWPGLSGAFVPFWIVITARVREAYPTDYERIIAQADTTPDRLIE